MQDKVKNKASKKLNLKAKVKFAIELIIPNDESKMLRKLRSGHVVSLKQLREEEQELYKILIKYVHKRYYLQLRMVPPFQYTWAGVDPRFSKLRQCEPAFAEWIIETLPEVYEQAAQEYEKESADKLGRSNKRHIAVK
jgi:hypothetical protein